MRRPNEVIENIKDFIKLDQHYYDNELSTEECIEIIDYIEQLEKAYEDVKKGLNNACNKLEGLDLCIDILTDKESKKDKEYWKKKVMEDD